MTVLDALLVATLVLDAGPTPADGGVDAAVTTVDAAAPDGGVPAEADAGAEVEVAETPAPPPPPPVGRIAGQVLAKGGREVISGASLMVEDVEIGTTDDRGDFSAALPCGQKDVAIQAAGFETQTIVVDACATHGSVTVRLVPQPGRARHETIVRSKPTQTDVRLVGEEMRQTPGALGDPLRVIESLPGVAAVAWPAPVYAVRGSNPGNTGFFLDGVQIPALFHLALGPSVIHPYFFRSIDFFPGSYPARYGRYVGGVVSAETRAPSSDAVHAAVDVRLYDAGAMVSAPLAGGAVAVAARYSYTGELISLLKEDIRLKYWDYQLRADQRVGPVQLTLLAFGSGDEFSSSTSDDRKELDLGFHRLNLRAALPLAGGSLQASVVGGTDHTRVPLQGTYPMVVDAKQVAPRLSYERTFGPVSAVAGFDGQFARYEPLVLGGAELPQGAWDIARRRDATLLAGYLSATSALDWVTVTPELRLDSYQVNDVRTHDWGPRLAIAVPVNRETTLRATGGRVTQLPSLPLQLPGIEAFGLQFLGLQSSWQGSLGVETSHFSAVKFSLTGFVQHYWLTDLRSPSATGVDPLADDFLARREALAYGVELLARRALTARLHGWISYTLSNNLRSYGGGAVGPTDWDQRHILNVVAGYRIGHYELGARFHFNTGRPIFLQNNGGDQYQRLPAYYQLDLRVDRPIYYNRFTLNVYVELVNATVNQQTYGYNEDTTMMVHPETYRIVLPSIGARAEF